MKHLRRTLCILLVMVLAVSVFCPQAFAWTQLNASAKGTLGKPFTTGVDTPNGEQVEEYYVNSGALPDGLTLGVNNACILITGTPTEGGIFPLEIAMRTNSEDYMVNMTISIEVPTETIHTTVKGKVGVSLEKTTPDTGDMMQDSKLVSGQVPAGLTVTQYDTYFVVKGTPTKAGNYYAHYYCETEGNPCDYTIEFQIEASTELTITKDPTNETVTVGEEAIFISAAENYSKLEWRVVTKDGSGCWRGKAEIEAKFPGVSFNNFQANDGREWLRLSNIPEEMDGYYIQTKFWSLDGSYTLFTGNNVCKLTVNKPVLKVPQISVQPANAEAEIGQPVTLSVTASDPNGGKLSYQWYSRQPATASQGTPVSGATSPTFTPPQTEGDMCYYCTVTSTVDNKYVSEPAQSQIATVTYKAAPAPVTPEPTVTEAPSVTVITPVPGATESPVLTPVPTASPSANRTASTLFYVLLVVFFLLLAALIVLLILNKRSHAGAAGTAAAAPAVWTCPSCGRKNSGKFCEDCGTRKP